MTALSINGGGVPTIRDLSFLADLPTLQQFGVFGLDPGDSLDPILWLSGLRRLVLPPTKGIALDLPRLTALESCSMFWDDGLASVLECSQLRELELVNYPDNDATRLSKLGRLEVLVLQTPKLRSFNGCAGLASLRDLTVKHSRVLTTIRGIESCARLERLTLNLCGKLIDIDAVALCPNLNYFHAECGRLPSLRPLARSPKLADVSLTGRYFDVADGDLTPLVAVRSLPWAKLQITPWHPHLRPTQSELFQMFQSRDLETKGPYEHPPAHSG